MRLQLEEFGPAPVIAPEPDAAEDEGKLQAYEQGYGAGWEDATKAQSGAKADLDAEVAQHLQRLAFGYQEARQHVLQSLDPLLTEITSRLLPALAVETLAPLVLEALVPLAEDLADAPIVLRVSPDARDAVERLVTNAIGLPCRIIEDDGLRGGCVLIATEKAEVQVDVDAAVASITQAVRDFFVVSRMETAHAG